MKVTDRGISGYYQDGVHGMKTQLDPYCWYLKCFHQITVSVCTYIFEYLEFTDFTQGRLKIFLLFQEHMDGKDKLLWRHSAFARPFRFMVVRGTLPLLQPDVLNNCAMDSSLNGRTAGGCTRKAFKLKVKHVDQHVDRHFFIIFI